MPDISLWRTLRHPIEQLQAFEARRATLATLPWPTWAALTGIAVGGSAIYGASLSRVLPRWGSRDGALWLALSSGAGWCLFGPGLIVLSGKRPYTIAHACMVTMAYGEGVLVSGAALNMLLAAPERAPDLDRARFNLAWVGLANATMATMLTRQLQGLGVPARTTLTAWMALLNGSGVLFFWLFARLLRRSAEEKRR